MGITDKNLIAQKVAIWEGMWAAKQSGDSVGVSILYSLHSGGGSGAIGGWNRGVNFNSVPCLGSLRCRNQRQSVISSPKFGGYSDVPYS